MRALLLIGLIAFVGSCNKTKNQGSADIKYIEENPAELPAVPYEMNSKPVLIENARIMTAAGTVYPSANIYFKNGLIQKISQEKITVEADTDVIDGKGLTVTPGIIDVHSHMGVYPSPAVDAHEDGNEMSKPVTSDVWAEHAFWPQDPDLWRALAGGVTTIQVLPGSGNLIGGRTFTAKLIPQLSAREMRFPGAPQGLKMACGENPKRVHKKQTMTRMGNVANYRRVFQEALEYARGDNKEGGPAKRNFVSETLVKVLKGEILLHFHCYRADDISAILDVAKEFGFKIKTVHHGLGAYKVARRLAKEDVGVATWADWWGFKMEAYDGIPHNIALLEKAGGKPIVHSDSEVDIRYLNVEAGKALASAKQLGLDFTEDQALTWVTKNAAWALGIDDKVGTLEEGKMADITVWDGHPFSITTKAKMVFINGNKVYDRAKQIRPQSDFEVGLENLAFKDGRDFGNQSAPQEMNWANYSEERIKQMVSSTISSHFLLKGAKAFINGRWQEGANILVSDGKITSINADLNALPKNLKIVDASQFHVTPGLIESSSALGVFEVSLDSRAQDLRVPVDKPTPGFRTADIVNRRSIRIPIYRAQGVTTSLARSGGGIAGIRGFAFDLQDSGYTMNDVALYGRVDKTQSLNQRSIIWDQVYQLLRDSLFYKNNRAKVKSGNNYNLIVSPHHLEAMQPIISGKKPWVVHVERASDIESVIAIKNWAKKNSMLIKFVIHGGAESWLVADKLKKEDIPVILSPSNQYPKNFDKTAARFDLAAALHRKGVEVLINDDGDLGAPRLRQEAGFAVKYGLNPEAALSAITETPAKVFGLKGRGIIAKGAVANLVLWSDNPLEPASQALKVWIGGEDQNLKNRHRQLAEKYLR